MVKIKGKIKTSKIVMIVILALAAFCQIFPFYLELVHALQPKSFSPIYGKLYLLPETLNLGNFVEAFRLAGLGKGMINTLFVTVMYLALSSIVVLIVGYVLGKKNFLGKKIIYIAFLSTMMIPGEVLLVPNYYIVSRLHLIDSLFALILPGIVNIFGIFLVMSYMNTIPDSLIEAARIDGMGELKLIAKVIFPLAAPILGTFAILNFVGTWNDYLWPSLVLKSFEKYTLQLKLMMFNPSFATAWDQILLAAGLIVTLFPVIVFYLIFQRQLIDSIALSGSKS